MTHSCSLIILACLARPVFLESKNVSVCVDSRPQVDPSRIHVFFFSYDLETSRCGHSRLDRLPYSRMRVNFFPWLERGRKEKMGNRSRANKKKLLQVSAASDLANNSFFFPQQSADFMLAIGEVS